MELDDLRIKIDQINHKVLNLLKERQSFINEVALLKKQKGMQIFDAQRELDMVANLRLSAKEIGLDPEMVGALFNLILAYSKRDMSIALEEDKEL